MLYLILKGSKLEGEKTPNNPTLIFGVWALQTVHTKQCGGGAGSQRRRVDAVHRTVPVKSDEG